MAVVKTKLSDVRIQILVFSDFQTDACKGHFWNRCTQWSFWAPMCENRKAILTDARSGLLGNGCVQGMRHFLDARNRAQPTSAGNPSKQLQYPDMVIMWEMNHAHDIDDRAKKKSPSDNTTWKLWQYIKWCFYIGLRPVKSFENSRGANSMFGQTQKVVSRLWKNYLSTCYTSK